MTTCVHRPHGDGVGVCASCLCDRLLALPLARVEQHSSVPAATLQAHPLPEPQPFRRASPPSSSSSAACRSPSEPLHPSICGRCGSGRFPVRSSLFARQRSYKAEPEPAGATKSPDVQARQRKTNSRKFTRGGKPRPESECNTESTSRSLCHSLPTNGRRADSTHHRHGLWFGLAGVSMCIGSLMRAVRRRRKLPLGSQARELAEDGQPEPPTASGAAPAGAPAVT